jgi:hypothetical protein
VLATPRDTPAATTTPVIGPRDEAAVACASVRECHLSEGRPGVEPYRRVMGALPIGLGWSRKVPFAGGCGLMSA